MIQTMWPPSSGEVKHYLLEIRDTRFFPDSEKHNSVTMVKHISSPLPSYQLRCEHNHSYKVRTKALSPSGLSSPFSEESILLICDQKNPHIELDRLPSPTKTKRGMTIYRPFGSNAVAFCMGSPAPWKCAFTRILKCAIFIDGWQSVHFVLVL